MISISGLNKRLPHSSGNNFPVIFIILSVLSILLGGFIYIFLRPSEHIFFSWISSAGLDHWFTLARSNNHSLSSLFPEWFIYSLPYGLWAFAYTLLLTTIWSESRSWLRYPWMISIPVLVLGFEVFQYAGIIPGTFCIQDLSLGIAGITLGFIVGFKTTNKNNYEKAIE